MGREATSGALPRARLVKVRRPAVAGLFYPDDPRELAATVDALLAATPSPVDTVAPKAIVVPHAGYVFSGPIAASAYARVMPARNTIRRVVLLGPSHRVALEGIARPSVDAFRTPLGDIPLALDAVPGVVVNDRAHAREHSLEVQLPFLQRALETFTLLPLVVGACTPDAVAAVLDRVWGGPETLIVVSTDLSHYEDHASAARHDRATADAIVARDVGAIGPYDACGAFPLRGLLAAATVRAIDPVELDLRSSGDTAGPRDRVVGYGAFALAGDATQ
jgi:AmmeMemoRadiSam system protein B